MRVDRIFWIKTRMSLPHEGQSVLAKIVRGNNGKFKDYERCIFSGGKFLSIWKMRELTHVKYWTPILGAE